MALNTKLQDPPLLPQTKEEWTIHTEGLLDEWRRQTINDLRTINDALETEQSNIDSLEKNRSIWVSAYPSGNQSLTAGVQDQLLFQTEEWDVGSDFASSTFTAPEAGKYKINTHATFAVGADGDDLSLEVKKNGSTLVGGAYLDAGGTGTASLSVNKTISLAVSDTIKVYVRNANTNDTVYGGTAYTWLQVQYRGT